MSKERIRKSCKNCKTSLHNAAKAGHDACVRALVTNRDLESTDENNYTPLMWAASGCQSECMRSLLMAGAMPTTWLSVNKDAIAYQGACPLAIAANSTDNPEKRDECVNLLLTWGASECWALMVAATYNLKNAEQYFLGRATLADKTEALHHAIYYGMVPGVIKLIERGASVNDQYAVHSNYRKYPACGEGHSALHIAVQLNHATSRIQIVKYFLMMGAYVNQKLNALGDNAIKTHIRRFLALGHEAQPFCYETFMLLYAAGDRLEGTFWLARNGFNALSEMRDYAKSQKDNTGQMLGHCIQQVEGNSLCKLVREAIRKHLLSLDEHTNLFLKIPKLGLPSLLQRYMFFDMSVEDHDGEQLQE